MTLTRRRFHQLAASTMVTAATVRAQAEDKAPKTRSKGFEVTIGVQSYSFRDRPLDQAIAAMAELGLPTCELWQGHLEPRLNKPSASDVEKKAFRETLRKWRVETPVGHFKEIAAKFAQAKVGICAYNYSFKDDFSDEEIDRGFVMARALGAPVITASAQQDVVPRVAVAARKHKMLVGMHNHSDIHPNEFATPADFEKAMQKSLGPGREYIAVNLDIGHFTAANFDSVAFLKKHHKRIVTLHIKDRKRDQGALTPFGEGNAPIREVLQLLKQQRWKIPANIEYEYPGADPVAEVKRCLDYCRSVLAT
jgi:sugar phosphate isomerase/epimerase